MCTFVFPGNAEARPIPVFPWHSLVPFLTNTQPAMAAEAPDEMRESTQQLPPQVAQERQDRAIPPDSDPIIAGKTLLTTIPFSHTWSLHYHQNRKKAAISK